MPAPMIYYVRHGETAWNAEGRLQGAQDTSLNDLGRKQAAHAGSILADLLRATGAANRLSPTSQVRSAARGRPWSWCVAP